MNQNAAFQPLLTRLPLAGLPVRHSTLSALEEGLTRSSFSYHQAAKIISADPNCTADFLAYTNEFLKQRPEIEVATPMHAAMMLGMEGLEDFPKALNTISVIRNAQIKPKLFQLESRALHAAHQARAWAEKLGNSQSDNIFIAALLGSVVEVILWQSMPKKMQQLEILTEIQHQSPSKAQLKVLGFTLNEFATALAKTWKLPKLFRETYEADIEGQPPQRVRIIRAANKLVRLIERGWYRPAIVEFFNELAADFKHSASCLASDSKKLLINISREHPKQFWRYPALHYLALVEGEVPYSPVLDIQPATAKQRQIHPSTDKQPTGENSESSPAARSQKKPSVEYVQSSEHKPDSVASMNNTSSAPAATDDKGSSEATAEAQDNIVTEQPASDGKAEMAKKLAKVMRRIEASTDFVTLIRNTTSQVHSTLGVPRVAFLLLSTDRKSLSIRSVVGNTDPVFAKLKLPLSPPNLFTRLVQKPQSINIGRSNRDKYASLITHSVRQQLKAQFFMARTVFFNKKPVGVFYADMGGDDECDPISYQAFKEVCLAFEKQMLTNAQNKAQASKENES